QGVLPIMPKTLHRAFVVFALVSSSLPASEDNERAIRGIEDLKGRITRNARNAVIEVDLSHSSLSDVVLLKGLTELEALNLSGSQINDDGLKALKELQGLQRLDLSGTHVTDEALKEVRELRKLRELDLHITQITDVGLHELKELPNLQSLNL